METINLHQRLKLIIIDKHYKIDIKIKCAVPGTMSPYLFLSWCSSESASEQSASDGTVATVLRNYYHILNVSNSELLYNLQFITLYRT